jgi:hypothetical protein
MGYTQAIRYRHILEDLKKRGNTWQELSCEEQRDWRLSSISSYTTKRRRDIQCISHTNIHPLLVI